ncbi:nucleolar phosphoprotein [Theileria orientalis]|uniref:Nucleolar phosphoprotein n=1 Tax=Theileria orientalis TaxID=68886 RepID=A0A976QSE9_THEOR|nr:nucleolar phosphoprotein [Theileria orientalis]
MEREVSYKKNNKDIIYVGNLPKELTEQHLKKYFNQFGNVVKIKLVKSKKTNRSKGYAFVQFENSEIAQIAADTMDKYLIDGKALKVHVKEEDQIVKHLFKRGRTMMIKNNKVKLMNSELDSKRRTMKEKLENIMESIKEGNKLERDEETDEFVNKLKRNLENLKDKQKRFNTDLYDDEIKEYTRALNTLKKHLKKSK